jgi:selenium metabolism protein YedF
MTTDNAPASATGNSPQEPGPLVVVISGDTMGRGDDELGHVLIRSHLHTLTEIAPRPDVLVFLNSGVKLATEGSPCVEDLQALATQGTCILLCGTCLGHFGLKEQVAVGEVSNMYEISETMLRAQKVVNL